MIYLKKISIMIVLLLSVYSLTGCTQKLSEEYMEHISKSQEDIDAKDYEGAMKEIEAALRENEKAPEAYLQKGFLHLTKGELNQAKDALMYVLEHMDDFSDKDSKYTAYLNMGNLYYQFDDNSKALTYFLKAKEINDSDPELYNAIGLVYMNMEETEKAVEAYTKAIDLDPNNFYAYGNMASVFLVKAEIQKGLNEINTALGLNPYIPQFYIIKGELLEAENKPDEAISVYTSALSNWDTFGDAYYKRGELYYKTGDYLNAIFDFSMAKDAGITEGLMGMGYSYKALNQYEDALDAFQDYLKTLGKTDLKALYEIAVINYQLERYQEAINAVDQLLTYEPSDEEAMLLKAYSLEKLETYDTAYEVLKKIIELNPEHELAKKEIQFIEENNLR